MTNPNQDPDCYQEAFNFYDSLQGLVEMSNGNMPLTIRHIAHNIVPDSPGESVPEREARVFHNIKTLGNLGLIAPQTGIDSKVYTDGDWLPVYKLKDIID